jgi:hypothetical protein
MAAHRHRRLGGAYRDRSAGRCHAPTLDPSAPGAPTSAAAFALCAPGLWARGNGGEDAPLHPCLDADVRRLTGLPTPQGFQPGALPLVTGVPDPDGFGVAGC